MCDHPEHRVEVLPDGQIDETHVFTDEEMKAIADIVNRTLWKMQVIQEHGPVGFQEVRL